MERRIGHRSDHHGTSIRWWPPRGPGASRRLFGSRKGVAAELVDVSLTGLLVEAPANEALRVGDIITVEVDGITGPVTLRRIVAVPGSPTWRYGVELLHLTAALTAHINAGLAERPHVAGAQRHRDTHPPGSA